MLHGVITNVGPREFKLLDDSGTIIGMGRVYGDMLKSSRRVFSEFRSEKVDMGSSP